MQDIRLEASWKEVLAPTLSSASFQHLREFVREEYLRGAVFPSPKNLFRALDACPFSRVRVVILGQDPYHGEGQANGLCFSVERGQKLPPSLQNIFKELEQDLGCAVQRSGDLSSWAKQGVLLLNATLTVRAHAPGSHQGKGWEEFTDEVVRVLSEQREGIVFLLWGNYAKKKGSIIDRSRHVVYEAAHPSPFSAYGGFFGCKHFSKTNAYLASRGQDPIDWVGEVE